MGTFIRVLNKIFNSNFSKQQLILKVEDFFFQNQSKILLTLSVICIVFLCYRHEFVVVVIITFWFGFLYTTIYILFLFSQLLVVLLFLITPLIITFWSIEFFIRFFVIILAFFSVFQFLFHTKFFALKLSPKLQQKLFEFFQEEDTKFLHFEALSNTVTLTQLSVFLYSSKFAFSTFTWGVSLSPEEFELLHAAFLCIYFYTFVTGFIRCLIHGVFPSSNISGGLAYIYLFMQVFMIFSGAFGFFLYFYWF